MLVSVSELIWAAVMKISYLKKIASVHLRLQIRYIRQHFIHHWSAAICFIAGIYTEQFEKWRKILQQTEKKNKDILNFQNAGNSFPQAVKNCTSYSPKANSYKNFGL